jgi:malonate-semialdehyde dehydrogenase (acetylating)/methylmalonate-semialdehyde dehydrogenase
MSLSATATPDADTTTKILRNYVNGAWTDSQGDLLDVINPSTGALLGKVPLSTRDEVEAAVAAARAAAPEWRRTPIGQRTRFVIRYRNAIEARHEDVSRAIAEDVGKTIAEARGEVTRSLDGLEATAAIPMLARGQIAEDAARGVEAHTIRQPLGVVGVISPFNFPLFSTCAQQSAALACGNTIVWKPSEQTPLANQVLFEIIDELGLPDGVWNLVNGSREVVEALCDADGVDAISFVGSAAVAQAVYTRATANGKRVQALGGAKNYMVVMPDAVMEQTATQIAQSGFGSSGQRCMAGSVIIGVGDAWEKLKPALLEQSKAITMGDALRDDVELGPVVSGRALEKIEQAVQRASDEGGNIVLDGRSPDVDQDGFFVGPTIVENVDPDGYLATEEIFGPALAVVEVGSLDEAIEVVNNGRYGNGTSLFTESGGAAARYRAEVEVGMIGVNIGVAAPVALFPFTGWKGSMFGDIPIQAEASVDFFTRRKTVTTRYFS